MQVVIQKLCEMITQYVGNAQMNKLRLSKCVKGIVHFEIIFGYVLADLKGIQDVGVFVPAVVSIVMFLGRTVLVC